MKDREAIARAYCKWSNVDPDMVFAVNEDMTEAAIPAWQQRTALGMADAIINGLADAGLTIASVASLTRAEEEREEAVKAMAPFVRDIKEFLDDERHRREWPRDRLSFAWSDDGLGEFSMDECNALIREHARLSRARDAEGSTDEG